MKLQNGPEAEPISLEPASGYTAWFKADAIVGLNDGDPVSTWDDSAPNNQDATQATASLKPIYKTNIVAGKPVIRFDGVDDRLVSPGGSGIWGLTNDFTVFAVVWLDPNQGTAGHDVVGSSAFANNLDLIARRNDANGNWLAYNSSPDGTRNSDLILSTGSWYVLTWRLKASSPKHLQVRADRVYRLNDTGYTGIGTAPSQAAIGARQNGANPFKGDIAEIIFYTGNLSDADMTATEDYLREKYGLVEPPPAPPAAPTGLTATAVDHQQIDLAWMDNATNEEGFRIERREGQTGTFSTVATVGPNITNYSNMSLTAETEFCYRVIAYNSGGDSDPSNVACATTAPMPPPPPYGDPVPGYAAWFKADAIFGLNDGDPVSTWDDSAPNNQDATQATASLKPIYKTNIVAGKPVIRFDGVDDRLVSPGGSGIWGLGNDFTVFAVVWLDPNQGTAGHDVVGSSAISNNLDLISRRNDASGNWLAYSSSPDGTRNSDLILSTGSWYVLTWRLKASSPKNLQMRADRVYRLNDTSYTGIGTAPSQAAIGARQNGANPFKGDIAEVIFYTGSLSDADMLTTENYLGPKYGLFVAPPASPTGLTATPLGHRKVDLSWTDNATNEEGFRIERREGQTGTFGVIATVMANVTTYSDSSLAAETEFCYRVVATNVGGDSDPSNVPCAMTGPAPPTDVTLVATQTNQIDLTWTDNSLTEQGFRIERREGQTGVFVEIASVAPGITTYKDQSVEPASEYCYRVAAFNGATSSYSSTECTTTPALTPVNCTTDPKDNRSELAEILTSPDHLDWRIGVGLSTADPNQLVLVTDNAICQALWSAVYSINPDATSLIAFFKLDNLYIVTNYLNADPSFGPIALGLGITSVVDEEFNVINPSLAH